MTKSKETKQYFGQQEEQAVIRFLESTSFEERNEIYNKELRKPFDKMIESIIRTYKLYRKNLSFEEIHQDALSFLLTKSDMYDHNTGAKSYSYYGTICRNYLLTELKKDDKKLKINLSYEDVHQTLDEDERYSYTIGDNRDYEILFEGIITSLKDTLKNNKKLSKDEYKVGEALLEIFGKVDEMIKLLGNKRKHNKDMFLSIISQYTGLDLKVVKRSLKVYKSLYFLVKSEKINNYEF